MNEKEFENNINTSFKTASRRARAVGALDDLTLGEWQAILVSSAYQCHYCQCELWFEQITLDHKHALSMGGANTAANIVPACKSCNSRKGTYDYGLFKQETSK